MGRAWVIDDSKAIRMILSRTLERLGFEVSVSAGGAEAVLTLAGEPSGFSVIFIDWSMPEMHGRELVAAFRANPEISQVPLIIMMDAGMELEELYEGYEAGASEYLMKPFTQEEIAEKLRLLRLIP